MNQITLNEKRIFVEKYKRGYKYIYISFMKHMFRNF